MHRNQGSARKRNGIMRHILLTAAILLAGTPLAAREHVVAMLNQGKNGAMVFEPGLIKAMPGDTVKFVATNPGHNAQTIPGLLPEGETEQKGAMGKDFVLTLKTPGLYGIKCLPHYSMGMVALVQVGNGPSPNLEAAKAVKLPPLVKKRMDAWLAAAK
jgi:pseudoazurin